MNNSPKLAFLLPFDRWFENLKIRKKTMEEEKCHWARRARITAQNSIHFNSELSIERFLDKWRKGIEQYSKQNIPEDEKKIIFDELELFLKNFSPPPENLMESEVLFELWEEYLKLSTSKEYILYYLQDNSIGVNCDRLYLWLARTHLENKDYILADEWVRIGMKRFQTQKQFIELEKEILEACKKRAQLFVKDLDELYSRNNWDQDRGLDASLFTSLLIKPIETRKSILFGNQENFYPLYQQEHGETKKLKRLSDSCLVEINKGAIVFIDRHQRDSYYGQATLLAREVEYREAQLQMRGHYRTINSTDKTYQFWMVRLKKRHSFFETPKHQEEFNGVCAFDRIRNLPSISNMTFSEKIERSSYINERPNDQRFFSRQKPKVKILGCKRWKV